MCRKDLFYIKILKLVYGQHAGKIPGTDKFQNYLGQAQIKMRNNELCDVCLASVDGQKFKANKIILSASSICVKKLLLNDKNPNSLIFIRRIDN